MWELNRKFFPRNRNSAEATGAIPKDPLGSQNCFWLLPAAKSPFVCAVVVIRSAPAREKLRVAIAKSDLSFQGRAQPSSFAATGLVKVDVITSVRAADYAAAFCVTAMAACKCFSNFLQMFRICGVLTAVRLAGKAGCDCANQSTAAPPLALRSTEGFQSGLHSLPRRGSTSSGRREPGP